MLNVMLFCFSLLIMVASGLIAGYLEKRSTIVCRMRRCINIDRMDFWLIGVITGIICAFLTAVALGLICSEYLKN